MVTERQQTQKRTIYAAQLLRPQLRTWFEWVKRLSIPNIGEVCEPHSRWPRSGARFLAEPNLCC
jgi:hypothetical protein